MSKRWLGLLLLLVWIGGRGVAHAGPTLSVSPATSLAFGDVRVNDSAAPATKTLPITLTNTGDADLVLSAITLDGPNSSDYRITPPQSLTVTAGQSATVMVDFNPSDSGPRTATVTVASNDPNDATHGVALTGNGTTAIIGVTGADFGNVNAGGSANATVVVSNTATTSPAPLTVTSATISGTAFVFGTGLGCNGGTSCTFAPLVLSGTPASVPVRCTPSTSTSGLQTETITFVSDSDSSASTTAQLTCQVQHPNLVVNTDLAFGDVPVGAPVTTTVTLTNSGNAPLTYSLSVPTAAQYTIPRGCTTGCSISAAGGANTATFDVTFTPTGPTSPGATITITSNDPDPGDGSTTLRLSGTGRQGVLALTPTSLAFGDVAIGGAPKPLTFTLKNTGNVDVVDLHAALTGTGAGYVFDLTSVPTTLAANTSIPLTASFAPTVAGASTNAIAFSAHWSFGSITNASAAVSLPLTGNGQVATITPSPTSLDFGDFRFDARPALAIVVTNTGDATVVISPPVFTPAAGTAAGEYAIAVTGSTTLTKNQQLTVTVTATPNNRIGKVSGTLGIHPSAGPDQAVAITGNAISAGIAVDPMAFDFGGVDVDGPPVAKTIALTNTGAATLDVTSITAAAGGSAAFHVTLPTAVTHVPPGGSFALTISYAPTVAVPATQPEQLMLSAKLVGVAGGPNQATILVSGHGIDRTLVVDAAESFPSAFRNPGDKAPVQAVTVHNTGEAVLSISAVMVTGEPVWHLVDPSPVEIAGGGAHDFLVKFSPTSIGPAPAGTLVLTNNDNARPMQSVTLTGAGVLRNVAFGVATPPDPADPTVPVIDLGEVGVGVPITLPGALQVANLDPGVDFTIRSIALDAGAAFQLDHAPADVALPAAMTKQFAVTIVATAAGPLTATATLYLDQDPVAHAQVQLTGNAVFVDAHGGGGCDAGGGGGGGLALGGALALGAIGRRRRRAAAAAGVAIAVLAIPAARADGVDLEVFAPTPATTGTGFQVQSPEVGASGSWVAGATVSYASNPLVLEGFDNQRRQAIRNALVERSTLVEPGLAYAFLDRFEAGVHLPIYLQSGRRATTNAAGMSDGLAVEPASGTATGNLTINLKAQLWRGAGRFGSVALGAGGVVVLPTAAAGQFTGADKPEGRLLLLAAWTPSALESRMALSVNVGPIVRGKSEYANIVQQSGVAWGAGASYRVTDGLWATAELFGEATPSGHRQASDGSGMAAATALSPVEWLAGITVKAERRFTIGFAAGRGVTNALGTPELRGVLALAFIPGAPAVAPLRASDPAAAERDRDGDGIPDAVDKCPDEPEDKDLFEDEDGCPDPDNDHDGIPDAVDKCPLDPEDKDGFQDEDGCPDKDNDGDGIPDAIDKCPNEPEDKDGFEDLDGCPDPDNDHDGIPDAQDKCPNQPETINGFQDDDGCPDKGDTTIVLSPDRIETLDPIQFNGNKLTRASLPVLGQVGATMRAHPEILRLRITVHVQPTRDPDADQTRSEKRAQAVREWLVQWGVAPARVEPRGFGGAKPLVPPDQRGAAKINDRIELIILDRK